MSYNSVVSLRHVCRCPRWTWTRSWLGSLWPPCPPEGPASTTYVRYHLPTPWGLAGLGVALPPTTVPIILETLDIYIISTHPLYVLCVLWGTYHIVYSQKSLSKIEDSIALLQVTIGVGKWWWMYYILSYHLTAVILVDPRTTNVPLLLLSSWCVISSI